MDTTSWIKHNGVYSHKLARLASNDQLSKVLTVGSYRDHANSEWFDYDSQRWVQTSAVYAYPTGIWVLVIKP